MLQSLKIQNIALIPQVEIEFDNKFNVMTGETGAGKSIIIGSFSFILGEKLNKSVIRSGAPSSKVDAVFSEVGAVLQNITNLCGIEFQDNTVILTRTLRADGKSECRINGDIVTAATLKEVAAQLINIHGQHEHEVLLKSKNHINILDSFGGTAIHAAKKNYSEEYEKLQSLRNNLKTFGGSDSERDRLIDMYQYQIKEIESARLRENEDIELQDYKQKMMNFEKINNNLSAAAQIFNSDEGMAFGKVVSALSAVSNLDPKIEKILESARAIQYDIDDVGDSIQSYLDGLEYDEEKFRTVDARLDEIKILKRKYGSTLAQVLAFLIDTRASLDFLMRSAEDIEKTKKQIAAQEKFTTESGELLTEARKQTAKTFEREMVKQLNDLGMPACKIDVKFERTQNLTSNGCDDVEFLFSANAGESVKPLASIISGGEMSRFMLALKTVTARIDNVSTLVFDEIDTGVGGTMGINIATKIQTLSKFHQVIVVTHLPQIAAMADTHFFIQKSEVNNKTTTDIRKLERAEQISELARMVGAAATDVTAHQHALAMKKWSDDFKSNNK